MAFCVFVVAGTADVQASVGSADLVGYSIRETAGAAATLTIRDGTSAAAPARTFVSLPANGVETKFLPSVDFSTGVFVDRTAGSTELVLYLD
jgi:hypothetical protein